MAYQRKEVDSLADKTADKLRTMIASSGLTPGEVFATEAELERKLKVSRPVVREAVSRIRALGLLDSRQCVGLIVANPDPIALFEKGFEGWVLNSLNLQQLAEFRYALEIGAIALAAVRASEEQLALLSELARKLKKETSGKSSNKTVDVDLKFHCALLRSTHNDMLIRMHNVITAFFMRATGTMTNYAARHTHLKAVREHYEIARAMNERDGPRARALLADHLAGLLENPLPR